MDLYVRHIPIDHISLADNLKAMGSAWRPWAAKRTSSSWQTTRSPSPTGRTTWKSSSAPPSCATSSRASGEIEALAYDAPDDLGVVVEEAEKTLFHVTEKRVSSAFKLHGRAADRGVRGADEAGRAEGRMAGIPSGFKDVDGLFHGFRGGDLVILAARPGVGKTSFALNLATNAAKAGQPSPFSRWR